MKKQNCSECHHLHIFDKNTEYSMCMKTHERFKLKEKENDKIVCKYFDDSFRFEDFLTHVLRPHYGHNITFGCTGDIKDPTSISIVCIDCNEVIFSDDVIELYYDKWYREQSVKQKKLAEKDENQLNIFYDYD